MGTTHPPEPPPPSGEGLTIPCVGTNGAAGATWRTSQATTALWGGGTEAVVPISGAEEVPRVNNGLVAVVSVTMGTCFEAQQLLGRDRSHLVKNHLTPPLEGAGEHRQGTGVTMGR